jgi:hypoxanthine phosphoribosyltransferase
VLDLLARHGARRVRLCTLLDRPRRRIIPLECDYRGEEAPEDFLVGYGLDLGERFRNLPVVVALDASALDAAPEELAARLYTVPRG